MKNYLANYNVLAVSANAKESALNTEQTLDTSLLVAMNTIISLQPRREDNKDEITGKEEADSVYDLGAFAGGTLEFDKAQAQHFGFAYAFALGSPTPSSWGTGYKHLIAPLSSLSNPSFTLAMRLGQTLMKRRFASMFIDQLTATFAKDSWAKLSLALKGTGKYTDNMYKELVTAAFNVASLELDANAVQGADAATRLDNVHQVRVLVPNTGEYQDVVVTAVSAATPAVLTITPPATATPIQGLSKAAACVVTWVGHGLVDGDEVTFAGITQAEWSALNGPQVITRIGDDSFSIAVNTSGYTDAYAPETDPGTIVESTDAVYEILYVPTEEAWGTFPARVVEPPLRVTDLVVKIGGKWDGTNFLGGHSMSEEIESIEHVISNNMAIEFRPGGTGTYASYAIRQGRAQVLKLNRQLRDFILQQRVLTIETFGVRLTATGSEFETGKNYYVDMIFPKCAVLDAPISVNGKLLAEAGDLVVLQDDTYGSVIVEVANKVTAYAA